MKRNLNKVFLSLLLVSFILLPKLVLAKTVSSDIISINETLNLDIDNVVLKNLVFKNYSKTTSQNFGLSGYMTNKNDFDVSLKVRVYYYDKDKKELVFFNANKELYRNEGTTFNLMSNTFGISIGDIDDIKYYSIKVEQDKLQEQVFTKPSSDNRYRDYPYVIDKYNVDVTVNEDNTYDIKETIDAYFNKEGHGFIYSKSLKNKISDVAKNTKTVYSKITNIKVNDNFEKSISSGILSLKIGSVDKVVYNEKKYEIDYKYILGKDVNKDYDELYYNIIGTEWDTVIGNVTFKITLPKAFDSSKLGFASGEYGSTDSDNIKYIVNGNVITGSYYGNLETKNGLTIRLVLDEGYFKSSSIVSNNMYLLILLPVLFSLLGYYLWNKYGRDDEVVETVEFYPPYNKNSLDIAYYYKGNVTNKDVISLLFYLASKGYIKIEEISKKGIFGSKNTYKIIKVKDYDGNDANEKTFFNGLFSSKFNLSSSVNLLNIVDSFMGNDVNDDVKADKDEVLLDDLKEKFYTTIKKIIAKENGTANHNLIYEKTGFKRVLIGILYVISILIMALPFYEVGGMNMYSIILFISGFLNIIAYIILPFNTSKKGLYIGSMVLFIISAIISIIATYIVFKNESIFMVLSVIWTLSTISLLFEMKYITKRNKFGIESLGKIRGFRNFLETAEKSKLEALVSEMPSYFYDILPYTYSLGVSSKWVKNFESISMEPPTWYVSSHPFNMVSFTNSINNCMVATSQVMTSMPKSDISSSGSSHGGFGGSSGGGFSGGGFGNGGGKFW